MENDDRIICPLTDKLITPVECMENCSIKENSLLDEFKVKKDWKEICRKCKYRNY